MNTEFGKMLLKEGHKRVEIRPHKGVVNLAGGSITSQEPWMGGRVGAYLEEGQVGRFVEEVCQGDEGVTSVHV